VIPCKFSKHHWTISLQASVLVYYYTLLGYTLLFVTSRTLKQHSMQTLSNSMQ